MLDAFIITHRTELIRRCREKARQRGAPSATPAGVDHGVPLFMDQLITALGLPRNDPACSAPEPVPPEPAPSPSAISRSASLYGAESLRRGYTVDQVVHDYGDVCQAITEFAIEEHTPVASDDFRLLNACLDNAIASAVAAHAQGHAHATAGNAAGLQARLAAVAAEQQRLADIAIEAYAAIRTGSVGLNGATGALLQHALTELRAHAERSRPGVSKTAARVTAIPPTAAPIPLRPAAKS